MREKDEDQAAAPEQPAMIEVSVRIPARVLADYDTYVGTGIYADRDEALRQGLIESWRYHRGRYSTLRIELRDPGDKRPETADPNAADVFAAGEALKSEDGD